MTSKSTKLGWILLIVGIGLLVGGLVLFSKRDDVKEETESEQKKKKNMTIAGWIMLLFGVILLVSSFFLIGIERKE